MVVAYEHVSNKLNELRLKILQHKNAGFLNSFCLLSKKSISRPAFEHIKFLPVSVSTTVSVPVDLPVGLNYAYAGKIDGNLAFLNSASTVLL